MGLLPRIWMESIRTGENTKVCLVVEGTHLDFVLYWSHRKCWLAASVEPTNATKAVPSSQPTN